MDRVFPTAVTVLQVFVSVVISSTTRSIVPSPSSYVTAILVSVLLLNIAPTMSCTASVVNGAPSKVVTTSIVPSPS